MEVNRVIVHELDADFRRIVIANKQVNLNSSRDIEDLILKVTKTFQINSRVSKAEIHDDSPLENIIATHFDFMGFSEMTAKEWFSSLMLDSDYSSTNLIFATVEQGDTVLLVCFEMANKSAYIKDEEDYVYNNSVLNATFASVKNGFVLDLNDGVLLVKVHKDSKDLLESTLCCTIKSNSIQSFETVSKIVNMISESRNEKSMLNTLKLKQVITDNQNFIESVSPKDLVIAVFDNLSEEELSFTEKELEGKFASEDIILKDFKRTSMASKHKIVTESGVEIIIPVDSVDINKIISVIEDASGRVNLSLNNVGNVI